MVLLGMGMQVIVLKDRETKRSRGFGFITFRTAEVRLLLSTPRTGM